MKYDPSGHPYRTMLGRLQAPARRFSKAVARDDWELAIALVSSGAIDSNVRLHPLERTPETSSYTDSGESLLHWMVRRQELDHVKALLDCGANPNLTTFFKETPLYWAARQQDLDMMLLLVEYGGDLTAKPSVRGNYVSDEEVASTRNAIDEYNYRQNTHWIPEDFQNMLLKKNIHQQLPQTNHARKSRKM